MLVSVRISSQQERVVTSSANCRPNSSLVNNSHAKPFTPDSHGLNIVSSANSSETQVRSSIDPGVLLANHELITGRRARRCLASYG